MKEKILKFIQNIKELLLEKRKAMPKMRFHQTYILQIEQDEKQLDSAYDSIEKVDVANSNLAARFLHYIIDIVIPVFSHWKERVKAAEAAHASEEHLKAKRQYETERTAICSLIENINQLNKEPLIMLQADIENPGNEIVAQYKQQRVSFLEAHGITEDNKPLSEIKLSL